jgi:molecular chaperone GrpE
VEGIKYVIKQFFQVLISQGISEINTLGEVFNPETMEAVKDLEVVKTKSTKLGNDNLVKKQIVPGYKLKDKVIRPARVVVSD